MYFFDYSTLIDPLLKDVRAYVTALSGAAAGQKIVDVCCGTGDQVFYYSRAGADAAGIDGNQDMIGTARKNQKRLGIAGAAFYLGDAGGLPFPDAYFDCASISLCLHEMEREKRGKTIAEMKRVVKKNGLIIFTDFNTPLPKNPVGYVLRAAEYIVGTDNYRCFRDYIKQGGLGCLLKENGLERQKEAFLIFRCLHIIKSMNP
jgi:ubiquinone/menaquinone biosynthesis C-methylase UbiE